MTTDKQTSFFKEYRKKGIPANRIPDEIAEPSTVKAMSAPDDMILNVSGIFDVNLFQ